jgi:hypothetical protein
MAYVALAGVNTLPVGAHELISAKENKCVEMRRTRLTVVRAKLEACLIDREAQIQVHGNRGRRYLEVCESCQMHQFDVPERPAGTFAANCVELKAGRGSRSWTAVIFILDMEVLLQNTQGEFYEITRVSRRHHDRDRSRGTHGDEY